MTTEDLENYAVKEREPVKSTYRDFEVVSAAPPSSGGLTVQQNLKLMEDHDVQKMGVNSPEYLHHLIEAMHLAYADRAAYMADEDFYDVPTKGLLDEEYIKERRKLINPYKATGVIDSTDLMVYQSNKKSYLPVIKVAESLGYDVIWNERENVVLLEKDLSHSDSPNDDDIITN